MNILYPGNNFLGHQSNTSHELHNYICCQATIVDPNVFLANGLDVSIQLFPYGDYFHIHGE